jgi:levanbiose-producing levanase
LVIDGQVYFSATGDGTPTLRDVAWDVHSLRGKTAHLEIVDESTSTAFGHIMVDQVMWGNAPDAVVGEADTPTAVNLKIGGATVRTVTGADGERLHWESWDVADFIGQTAQIEVVDQSTAGWGHVNVDEITFSDRPLG